ncbi:MAG: putative porin [Burkholderiales bacterium]|nr:putative porin [Burkholderiales bacterium]
MKISAALFLAMFCSAAFGQESQFDKLQEATSSLVKMLVQKEVISQDAANLLTGNPDQMLGPMIARGRVDALQQTTSNLIQMLAQKDILPQDAAGELMGKSDSQKETTLGLIDALQKNEILTKDDAAQLTEVIDPPPPKLPDPVPVAQAPVADAPAAASAGAAPESAQAMPESAQAAPAAEVAAPAAPAGPPVPSEGTPLQNLVTLLVQKEVISEDAANLVNGDQSSGSKVDALQQSTSNLVQMLVQKDILTQDVADDLAGNAAQATPESLKQANLNIIDALQKGEVLTGDEAAQLVRQINPPAPVAVVAPVAASAVAASVEPVAAPAQDVPAPQDSASAASSAGSTMKNLVAMLVQKGVITQDAANQLLHDAPAEPVKPGEVRVPYVPQVVREQIKAEIKQEVLAQAQGERWGDPGALPGWLSRISWSGDFRVRFERDNFPAGNAPPLNYNPNGLTLIANTTDTHDYLRLQARLGMKAKISDYTSASFRITTGTTTNPVSTNQTMGGGNGNFNKYTLVLDRAYIQSEPYIWLSLGAGKIPNPWLSTDLVWDSDVNFEGIAATFKPRFSEEWSAFMTAGAFPVQDIERSTTVLTNSKWLYGAQAGGEWTSPNQSTAKFGVALYDFANTVGLQNTVNNTNVYDKTAVTASSYQKGNSLMYVTPPYNTWGANGSTLPTLVGLASKYRELNLTGKLDLATFDPTHIMLDADYVKNIGFDANDILQRTGNLYPYAGTVGYQVKLSVGVPEIAHYGEWQANVSYKYLESDAVLDALTDSDFHLGGTNAKGYILGGAFGVDERTWLSLRWLSTNQIKGPTLSIDTLQLDLNTRF